ncbi:MAG: CRISPR-associated endonuclease Cas2 [Spirochaetota bacterium]|jgi:CRISPR-associated protein Cas2|uniref:CRISPR-associated endonuclease Cas2 n=1 Tax=Rectinema subterraneum TaxID=2653714 RepID=UPI00131D2940|nr:CRISPR-associated endonuclease Cas2 [Rectinema subterraneum]
MHWLVVYDITDPKRLRKTAKILEAYGNRIQRSVFEIVADKSVLDMIEKRISLIMEDPDSIAYIPLCQYDYASVERFGKRLYDTLDTDSADKTIIL